MEESYNRSVEMVMAHPHYNSTNSSHNTSKYLTAMKKYQTGLLKNMTRATDNITIGDNAEIYETLVNIAVSSLMMIGDPYTNPKEVIIHNNRELFKKKNSDYGNSFEDFGLIGIIVRLNDKINRILNLGERDPSEFLVDEKLEDTINDLYNYCIIGLMYK